MKSGVAMEHIWKIRLSLMVIAFASLGLMVYCFEQMPKNELGAVLAFLVFFASAMALLYTAHMDERPAMVKKRVRAAA